MKDYPLRPEPESFRDWEPCECGHYSFDHTLPFYRLIISVFTFGKLSYHGKCEKCECPQYKKAKFQDWMNEIIVGKSRACFASNAQHELCQNPDCNCTCVLHNKEKVS